MIQVRQGVFETNSSSTHVINVVASELYDELISGKAMVNLDLDIIPNEEALKRNAELKASLKYEIDEDDIEDLIYENFFVSWEDFREYTDYELFECKETIKGVDVVAFGYQGYDY